METKEEKPQQRFFKNKWKKVALVSSVPIIAGAMISLAVYKYSKPFKPAFYNYKSYMYQGNIDKINNNFTYKVFDEIIEFTTALTNRKVSAGIGSEFQAVGLIKKDLIRPINFQKFFQLDHKPNKTELEAMLKNIYTEPVWKHLASYDKDVNDAKDLNEEQWNEWKEKNPDSVKHLWEYVLPYYVQDSMIGYNPLKSKASKDPITEEMLRENAKKLNQNYWNKLEKEFEKEGKQNEFTKVLNGVDQSDLKPFNYASIFNIFNYLSHNGYSNFVITDAVRNNMLYGSAYNKVALDSTPGAPFELENLFTGNTTIDNYKWSIDNFISLVQDSTSFRIADGKNIAFDGDGQNILRNLIDPSRKDVDVALMFNGDALDAYYSEDNELRDENGNLVPDGTIQAFKFNKNIILLDTFVVAKDVNEQTEDIIYDSIRTTIFANLNKINDVMATKGIANKTEAIKESLLEYYQEYLEFIFGKKSELLNSMLEQLKTIYKETIKEEISNEDLQKFNEFVAQKFENNPELIQQFKELFPPEKENAAESDEEFVTRIANILSHVNLGNEAYFEEIVETKYPNLTNFDFINYTPSTTIDYEFIRRNYFITDENEYDLRAIKIYEIALTDKQRQENFEHKGIGSVDDKLRSQLDTYYFNKTKS
ncbi:hypothetical protein VO56_00700 [Mycoplasmopsis gallinacea]|uniref:Uncharacterized protein n=1 Tax=Mycoplasmopsis gallinacea TaxID=29556 RepID=A0A0D5ZJ21_9BACT|nr:hypothetical protein VO56_00700 [Mycoplasmopsis gallinacea]